MRQHASRTRAVSRTSYFKPPRKKVSTRYPSRHSRITSVLTDKPKHVYTRTGTKTLEASNKILNTTRDHHRTITRYTSQYNRSCYEETSVGIERFRVDQHSNSTFLPRVLVGGTFKALEKRELGCGGARTPRLWRSERSASTFGNTENARRLSGIETQKKHPWHEMGTRYHAKRAIK